MARILTALNGVALAVVVASPCNAATTVEPPIDASSLKDGKHDFDFELGTWRTPFVRRLHPLTGSTTLGTFDATTTVRPVWDEAANIVELVVDGPSGHFQGLSLRTYNPQSRNPGNGC